MCCVRSESEGSRVFERTVSIHGPELVDIFDSGPDLELVSVEAQRAFQREWLASRGISPASAALHIAAAVAIGAFGLAVGANVHSLSVASTGQHREVLLMSLAIWPLMTAIPAFLVARAANVVLARVFGDHS